jgi:hypothetical protein
MDICSFLLLPSFNAENDAPPGALCTLSVTLLAAGIGLVTAASNAGGRFRPWSAELFATVEVFK